jgi:putative peptidoglycan lipid II flippase
VTTESTGDRGERASILSSSAVMAAGTVVSRLSGLVRGILLAAALGAGLHADLFTIANTIPNMLYILLAGGVFNAVLVPQLVRAMERDPDRGEAYTNRVVTLAALFLGAVTVLLVLAAPWVMQIFLSGQYDTPQLAEQRESVIAFARYCLPQVFFYGMFVLVGQVLNSRHVFGPMMWAPIANNVIAVGVLVLYLLTWGPAPPGELTGPYEPAQEALLGIGSTLGIVAQFLILVPYLRRAGVRYRPRVDFRGTGLGHTLRLGSWTVLFVIVNQLAYTVVVKLASGGTAAEAVAGPGGDLEATGYTVYSTSFLIVMVPHSVITVSLATAILPRLSARAADGDLAGLAGTLAETMRTALAVMIPFAALLPVVALDLAHALYGYGANSETWVLYGPTLSLFGFGILFFTVHYLVLRGFYAIEETRTVFFIQCAVAGTNILAAVLLVRATGPAATSPSLVVAYGLSYLVGSVVSLLVLRNRLGTVDGGRLARFVLRVLVATSPGIALAWVVTWWLRGAGLDETSGGAMVTLAAAGLVAAVTYLLLARLLRLREVTDVLDLVTRRVRGRRAR